MHAAHTATGTDALVARPLEGIVTSLARGTRAIRKPRVATMPARVTDGERHPVTTWTRMSDTQVIAFLAGEFTPTDVRYVAGGVLYTA